MTEPLDPLAAMQRVADLFDEIRHHLEKTGDERALAGLFHQASVLATRLATEHACVRFEPIASSTLAYAATFELLADSSDALGRGAIGDAIHLVQAARTTAEKVGGMLLWRVNEIEKALLLHASLVVPTGNA